MTNSSADYDITAALAQFASSTRDDDLPRDARAVMGLSVIDWLAVGLAGRDEPVARAVRALVVDEGGAPQAHTLGLEGRFPARAAALLNGTASHALDYDDTHFGHIGHPSVAVVSAALAVAEKVGASGAAFQAAALIGVEASVRVGLWLGRGHYQIGYHQTATAGAFGAGLAAGRLLGLTAGQMADVLGVLSTRASGLKSQFGTMGKPFNAGIAAANGVEAALLVAHGLQPRRGALDGPQGFGETHHGAADPTAIAGLGQVWLFEQVSHKFHACCHGLHATLDALADASAIGADTVERVDVRTSPRWLSVCNVADPTGGLEAKFSYAQVVAMRLLGHDTARLDSYCDALCHDPQITALRRRVAVSGDDTLSETQARVTLHLTSGEAVKLYHDLLEPQPLALRDARVRAKAESLLGATRAAQVQGLVDGLADPSDIGIQLAQV
ncbi:MmgE/PrpD family protein [Puniceibacterium sp. IMCC21224]|uniref:MmgE/PrpD family protein n=1 Tax=Puniceibacterium sp. IMCC21224 TaxID=1618204 RepID=UPI00064DEC91|nr:MmgE/PrpD family protein [Puniceibacterium sp. IMCC21224]KMK66954.1 uncharacterized protein involved in propionate catabolism [Puniceibacterium sp. IMCC21224]